MSEKEVRKSQTIVTKDVQGIRAGIGTDSAEIFIDFPLSSPRYYRVRRGDIIQEGDIEAKTGAELESPTLTKWIVTDITSESVIGRDTESGDKRVWERDWFEERLMIGQFSTSLTDFERVSVIETGDASETIAGRRALSERPSSGLRVVVTVYGDNGQKFGRTYRFAEGDERSEIRLESQTPALEGLDEELTARLERAVHAALNRNGYVVRK